jgi:hypothetical protein
LFISQRQKFGQSVKLVGRKVRMIAPKDIEAIITLLPTEQGGKTGIISNDYRSQFRYDGQDWDVRYQLIDNFEVRPGETAWAIISFLSPQCHIGKIYEGMKFEMREGGKTIGEGKVTKILELEESAKKRVVLELYETNWENSVARAKSLLASNELADSIVRQLTVSAGWRERVAASKVIAAFQLKALIPDLIATFDVNPENYTCLAFSTMVTQVLGETALPFLDQMICACPSDSYGAHLRDIIERQVEAVRGVRKG